MEKKMMPDEYISYLRKVKDFENYLEKMVKEIKKTFRDRGQFYKLDIDYADFATSCRNAVRIQEN